MSVFDADLPLVVDSSEPNVQEQTNETPRDNWEKLIEAITPTPRPHCEPDRLVNIVSQQISALLEAPTELVRWTHLMKLIVKSFDTTLWATEILQYTSPVLKVIFLLDAPPRVQIFDRMPWLETDDFGVYGCMLTPETDGHHDHLYVGSGTGVDGPPKRRKDRESQPYLEKNNTSFFHRLLLHEVPRRSVWVSFLRIPDSQDETDVYKCFRNRVICLLAEATFTTLLHGYSAVKHNKLSVIWTDVCEEYDPRIWHGLCSHVCTSESLKPSIEIQGINKSLTTKWNVLEVTNPEEAEKLRKEKAKESNRKYRLKKKMKLKALEVSNPEEAEKLKEKERERGRYSYLKRKMHLEELEATNSEEAEKIKAKKQETYRSYNLKRKMDRAERKVTDPEEAERLKEKARELSRSNRLKRKMHLEELEVTNPEEAGKQKEEQKEKERGKNRYKYLKKKMNLEELEVTNPEEAEKQKEKAREKRRNKYLKSKMNLEELEATNPEEAETLKEEKSATSPSLSEK